MKSFQMTKNTPSLTSLLNTIYNHIYSNYFRRFTALKQSGNIINSPLSNYFTKHYAGRFRMGIVSISDGVES